MGMQLGGVASPVAGPVDCPYANPETGNTTMKRIIFFIAFLFSISLKTCRKGYI
jgi:hypothetical protein